MASLAKPEIEFTHIQNSKDVFTFHDTDILHTDGTFTKNRTYTLSFDPNTQDKTVLKEHAPGSVWGGNLSNNFDKDTVCSHEYWEECYIIEGRLYDAAWDVAWALQG
ncbi:hypothetical protein PRZ48_013247 [Zasmidium cellare]|uniref:Uncharacterized protein n=1 Tax=Zasmidium cellare TaxID=395010 RepID=A0ABR0E3I8_ZASCE|nr:hypothetical protein PRZ48_013247 [Zasmidium cellare]